MKTRFYSYMTLLAVATLLAACSSEEEVVNPSDEMTVQFTASLDGMIDSRAISDGSQVDVLTFAAFDAEGNEYRSLRQTDVAVSGGTATVTTRVVKGQRYRFVFWAQNSTCQAYTLSEDMKTLSVDYDGMKANDETRDAFYAVDEVNLNEPVTGPFERNVTLRRPFAQLNFGTTAEDLDAANLQAPVTGSWISVEGGVYSQLNLLDGTASHPVAIEMEAGPLLGEKLIVDNTEYEHISMNYLLASPQPSKLTNVTMTTVMNRTNLETGVEVNVPSLPIQRNYRTNVVGRLLTQTVEWQVIIDPSFGNETNYDANASYWDSSTLSEPTLTSNTYNITEASQLAWFQTHKPVDGATIRLKKPLNFAGKALSPLFGGASNITVEGNEKAIRNFTLTAEGSAGLFDAVNLTINNLTIDKAMVTATADAQGNAYAGVVSGHQTGTLTLNNVIVYGSQVQGICGVGGIVGYAEGLVTATGAQVGTSTILNTDAANAGCVGALIGRLNAGAHSLTDCEVSNAVVRCFMANNQLPCGKFIGCLRGDVANLQLVRCITMAYYEGKNEVAQAFTPYSDLIGGVVQ